jgi:hypothetical protein
MPAVRLARAAIIFAAKAVGERSKSLSLIGMGQWLGKPCPVGIDRTFDELNRDFSENRMILDVERSPAICITDHSAQRTVLAARDNLELPTNQV